ncbi:MAG: hypothetical protein ACRBDI_04295 [Alphaproteobacteria bacterium]
MISKTNNQSGNVLFFILIAVALFAALSYAVTTGNRGAGDSSSGETSLIASSEITQYGTALENALTYLTVSKQCNPDEMSFERSPFDGSDTSYINPSAPSNLSCHVFSSSGGRAATMQPPSGANNDNDEYAYIETQVLGIGADQTLCGADCADIVLILKNVNQSACKKFNLKLKGDPSIPIQDDGDNYENEEYTGIFNGNTNIDGGASGHRSLCIQSAGGTYYFYHVLLPR